MKRIGSCLPLAMLLAAACAPAHSAGSPFPEPGDRVRYSTVSDTGRRHVGRTVRLHGDTIVIDRLVPSMTGGAPAWASASFVTPSLARLEKRVGRRGHAGRGALIGGGAGLLLGMLCTMEDEESFPQSGQGACFSGGVLLGVGTGALIGMAIRSDVWEPVVLPLPASFGVGVRVRTPGNR